MLDTKWITFIILTQSFWSVKNDVYFFEKLSRPGFETRQIIYFANDQPTKPFSTNAKDTIKIDNFCIKHWLEKKKIIKACKSQLRRKSLSMQY